jgi:hypothetical protein
VLLDNNLVSQSSKCQNVIFRLSAEPEYRVMANGVAEACWLRQLLQELHNPLLWATPIYNDNVSTVYLSTNPISHHHTNMLRLISTLSVSTSPSEMFMFSTS